MSRYTVRARSGQDRTSLYAEITDKIIAELEAGRVPWVQPWGTAAAKAPLAMPKNATTQRRYSGVNVLILWGAVIERGFVGQSWLTFRQALSLGGNVRKGEHGTKVFFVKQLQVRDQGSDDNSSTRLVPMMREYTVFNVEQCENSPIASTQGSQCAFAILTRATSLPTTSCAPLAPIFARVTVKRATSPAEILSQCRRSPGSRARITSTTWHSTN